MARTKNGLPHQCAMHNIAKLGPAAMANIFRHFVIANTERPNRRALFWVMAPRKKSLEQLKSEAIAELERRGYDVRGKTPAQIKQILRRRPIKSKLDSTPSARR